MSVPDEAVEAANAALAEERRLPVSSMRAAILAAQPVMAEQLEGAVEDAEALYALVRQARDKITDTDWCRRADATMAATALRAREGGSR